MTTMAFIGLGNMGLPMMKNLVGVGHKLQAFDLSEDARQAAQAAGATACATIADAVTGAEVVITMLPSGKIVDTVYGGEGGVFAHAAKGTLFIDSSTIDVATARSVAAQAKMQGFMMVDAPVSGGVGGAEAGTLAFMVGGSSAAFSKAEPVLGPMGAKIVHCGESGNGQAAKACNNMLLAISMIGVSEAFNLGRSLGLDDQVFFDVASNASGQCWSLTSYCPVPGPVPASPANKDYAPGFAADLMLKDLNLALAAAEETGASIPLGSHSRDIYTKMAEAGLGSKDFSAVIKHLKGEFL